MRPIAMNRDRPSFSLPAPLTFAEIMHKINAWEKSDFLSIVLPALAGTLSFLPYPD